MSIPPLPPGFVLDAPQGAPRATIPPLPEGFVLDGESAIPSDGPPITDLPAVEAERPTIGQRLRSELRGLGLGARSVLQSAGGLVGAIGGDFVNAAIVPGEQPSYRDAAGALGDMVGLPRPRDSRERVLGDIGEGLAGTGLTLGIGGALNAGRAVAPTLARAAAAPRSVPAAGAALGDVLTTQPVMQAVSAAGGSAAAGATRESGGGTGSQILAGLAGGMGPGMAAALGGAATRGAVRGRSGTQMQRTVDDFAELGATPSVGQASQNRFIQGAENLLGGAPTSAGVIGRFVEKQADDIGEGLSTLANRTSRNASAERAGRAVEKGADQLQRNTSATKQALYWRADQFIPGDTPVGMSNTWQALSEMTTPTPGAAATTAAMSNPGLIRLRDNLMQDLSTGGGQIPYEALKSIRSRIGEQMTDFSMQPETSARELRRLYASLSRDMEAAAQSQGPDAVNAARRANNYTRAAADRMEQVQRVIDKQGGPERVYNAVLEGAKDGGTTLRAVMQSLPPDGQRAVTGAVVRRMGMATPGAQDAAGETFSAASFLTSWNRVSKEARRALFDRYGPGYSKDIDRLARVADNIKSGAKIYANPPGTANRAAAMTYGAALVGSLFTGGTSGLLAAGAGANLAARILTNPAAVRWLARSTTAPIGSVLGGLGSLRNIAANTQDEELAAIADELSEVAPDEG